MKKVKKIESKNTLTSSNSNPRLQLRGVLVGLTIGLVGATSVSSIASMGAGGNPNPEPINPTALTTAQNNLNLSNSTSTAVTNSYSNTVTSNIPTITATPVVADSSATEAQAAVDAATVGCGDAATEGSIAWTQQEVIKNRQILNTAPVDVDALFNGSSGSGSGSNCFADITKLIDLSVAIPDFSGMKAAAIAALRQYAQRKVCTMVKEATEKALAPLNNAIEIINKNGTIDLNGAVSGSISGGLSKLDPELANLYETQAPKGESVNLFPAGSTDFSNDINKVQDTVNNAIGSIGGGSSPTTTTNTNTGSSVGNSDTTWNNSNHLGNQTKNLTENVQAQTNSNAQQNTETKTKSSLFESIFN
ncbi:hypothetical protein [Acinetobacter sp. Marseille-Q1618]|uniref:hypothetical protein n=1 Tax=Acinetobacter sp. Marseille-Q1618 TaxID=2697502 RepID=UPI00156F522B|nr:hypothetical protein [Acinetobacter sp. Marseille-Q1618]